MNFGVLEFRHRVLLFTELCLVISERDQLGKEHDLLPTLDTFHQVDARDSLNPDLLRSHLLCTILIA